MSYYYEDDEYLEHALFGRQKVGHKYIDRIWKNGKWNYVYKHAQSAGYKLRSKAYNSKLLSGYRKKKESARVEKVGNNIKYNEIRKQNAGSNLTVKNNLSRKLSNQAALSRAAAKTHQEHLNRLENKRNLVNDANILKAQQKVRLRNQANLKEQALRDRAARTVRLNNQANLKKAAQVSANQRNNRLKAAEDARKREARMKTASLIKDMNKQKNQNSLARAAEASRAERNARLTKQAMNNSLNNSRGKAQLMAYKEGINKSAYARRQERVKSENAAKGSYMQDYYTNQYNQRNEKNKRKAKTGKAATGKITYGNGTFKPGR